MTNKRSTESGYTGTDDTNSLVKEQVKQGAETMVDQTQEKASQIADQAKSQATTLIESQKSKAAESMTGVADALRQTGQQLQENQPTIGNWINTAADRVEGVAGTLNQQSMGDMVTGVENFARRNSSLFLGSAFALGFAATRFLKSSSPSPSSGPQYRTSGNYGGYSAYGDYGRYAGGAQGYGAGYGGVTEQGTYGYSGTGFNYGAGDAAFPGSATTDISGELAYTDEAAQVGGETSLRTDDGTTGRSY